MIQIDPARLDLAREFRARPFGVHSPDLQAVLNRMRGGPGAGRYVLYMTRPHAEWVLGRMTGTPPFPELLSDHVFTSLEEAEWGVFKLRWKELTGQALELPDEPPPRRRQVADPASLRLNAPALLAYSDEVSVAPGERIGFKVSAHDVARYRADIVRLFAPETGPDAPGFREEVVPTPVSGEYPGRVQELHAGSYATIPFTLPFAVLRSFTLQAFVWPTRLAAGAQALLGTWSETAAAGFGLGLDTDGALELRVGNGGGDVTRISTGVPLTERRWHFVAASFDGDLREVRLWQEPLPGATFGADAPVHVTRAVGVTPAPGPGPFLLAAWHRGEDGGRLRTGGHLNGKLDRPRVASRALDRAEMAALVDGPLPAGLAAAVVAAWDLAADAGTTRIIDRGPNRLHGETVNQPARTMTGHNWTGAEHDFRRAPEQYGAIHFHEDDLDDARWADDFAVTVPPELPSGAYAARLQGNGVESYVPFFVRPPRGPAATLRPSVAYLAATATYTVYANNRLRFTGTWTELVQGRLTVLDATDLLLFRFPALGVSTYDLHSDGSGVCYGTRLRPVTNFRPTGRLWNYCADLFVVDWLERTGIPYDVITDDDLHAEGLALLEPYRVIVTGTHPEYDSLPMLDALDAYLRRGGRLMYLGGNGFYWRVAYHPIRPGIVEVRRAEDGTRAWAAEPGESYMSLSGEYGGLWRRQGRAPNCLAGVGFISQGFDASSYYRRNAASRDPRAAFIFAGVDDEILGDFGTLRGGAAGLEIDSYDRLLGSPEHALVVASSENHSNSFELVTEAVLVAHGATDGPQNPAIRADMVFFETPNGGAVFSTGSIAYAGSLSANGYDNNIARLTTNVLRRFADPAPFALPGKG
ncbi:MAG TPA: LamG domain-containing protein [Methylomirabilota bacterium]|nr:LamG domain-containing protein [Methylomirabilota bacterium]